MAVARRLLPKERYLDLREEFMGSVTAAGTGYQTSCRLVSPYVLPVGLAVRAADGGQAPAAEGDNRARQQAPMRRREFALHGRT